MEAIAVVRCIACLPDTKRSGDALLLPCSQSAVSCVQLGTHLRAKKKREEMSALMRKAQQKK